MEIGFNDVAHLLYVIKLLYDLGKFDIVKSYLNDELSYDLFYETLMEIMDSLFTYSKLRYYERHELEVITLSDKNVEDYYTLAGRYGEKLNLTDNENPYFKKAEKEADSCFYFSYSLTWRLMGHSKPKRPYHSRLALFIHQDGEVDIGGLTIGVVRMYKFFRDGADELRKLFAETEQEARA